MWGVCGCVGVFIFLTKDTALLFFWDQIDRPSRQICWITPSRHENLAFQWVIVPASPPGLAKHGLCIHKSSWEATHFWPLWSWIFQDIWTLGRVSLMRSYSICYFFTCVTFYYSLLLPQWASMARLLDMGSIFVWCNHLTGSSANAFSCLLIQVVPLGKYGRGSLLLTKSWEGFEILQKW